MAAKTELFAQWSGGSLVFADQTVGYGDRYFVKSGTGSSDTAGYGASPTTPLATLDYAIGRCTANHGDIIYLLPGHAETIGAGTVAFDVAGVTVIGLGKGALRPTFTFSNTASKFAITAGNVTIKNVLIVDDVDNCVVAISLSADADGTTLEEVEVRDGADAKDFTTAITVAAGCTDVTLKGFRFLGLAGGMTDCITLSGAADRFRMLDSYIRADASDRLVDGTAAASTNVEIARCTFINIDAAAGLGVAFHNSTTGFIHDNRMANLKDTVVGFSGTGLAYSENYGSNALGASGIILPGADT